MIRGCRIASSTRHNLSAFEKISKPTNRTKTARPKLTKKAQTTCKKGKEKVRLVSDSELDEGCDSEENALMLKELERLKASNDYAPPL
jgi:hypothetical protein